MEREIANVMKASGLREFRYVAFPPIVFEVPDRPMRAEPPPSAEPPPNGPELVMAPENEPPAPPEPSPALPPLAPLDAEPSPRLAEAPAPPARRRLISELSDIPAVSPASRPVPHASPPSRPPTPSQLGTRLLSELAEASAPLPPAPPAPDRFALLDDLSTELRHRRARTGRRQDNGPT